MQIEFFFICFNLKTKIYSKIKMTIVNTIRSINYIGLYSLFKKCLPLFFFVNSSIYNIRLRENEN